MNQIFIHEDSRFIHDTVSGMICEITRLEKEMLPYLKKLSFLPHSCPTTLRYSLAKYESEEVNEAYERLASLIYEGRLCPKGSDDDEKRAKIDTSEISSTLARRAVHSLMENIPSIEEITLIGEHAEEVRSKVESDFTFLKLLT